MHEFPTSETYTWCPSQLRRGVWTFFGFAMKETPSLNSGRTELLANTINGLIQCILSPRFCTLEQLPLDGSLVRQIADSHAK